MKDIVKVYVDRVRDGNTDEISEELPSSFMDVHEKDIRFEAPIFLTGEAYVTDDYLIVSLTIETEATLICSVCNEPFTFAISIHNMMHEEPLENIKEATFDILPLVRESILLEIPLYPQCGITSCNRREEIEPYLKKEQSPEQEESQPNGHNPFKDLL